MAVIGVLSSSPSPKKTDGNGDQVVDDKIFITKRKPPSTTPVKGVLNNGENTLNLEESARVTQPNQD